MNEMKKNVSLLSGLFLLLAGISMGSITLYSSSAGDAMYAWNSKYGSYGYTAGTNDMGVGLQMGGQYGNDYTVSVFEIPIAALAGKTITAAALEVESLGFGTGYYYGSANIGWLDTGSQLLTGDVVADNLGPAASGRPNHFTIYNSDTAGSELAGIRSFDVLDFVLADLAAGRTHSTFVMSGSRETNGSIYTAESGFGPRIVAVPEPATFGLLALSWLFLRKAK